jgi:small-conductance mechanosensitive channel
MSMKRNGMILVLLGCLAAVIYGVYWTAPRSVSPPPPNTGRRLARNRVDVDQGPLMVAERLVRMPTTPEERSFAEDALRLADQEMDLAFAQAVRRTTSLPRDTSAGTKELEAKLEKAQRALALDQERVKELTAAAAKATPVNPQGLTDQLNLTQAQATLDQDEVDDVTQDLRRAGGDQQGRIQEMIQEHEAVSRSSDSVRVNAVPRSVTHGLVSHVRALQDLYQKEAQLQLAADSTDSLAKAFTAAHDRLEARDAVLRDSLTKTLSHDSSTALLAITQRRARNEKARTAYDQRIEIQHKLGDVYLSWIGVMRTQEWVVINRAFKSLAAILVVILVALLAGRALTYVLEAKPNADRRRTQTLHMVARVSLQMISVFVILLILFGPPDNLGTFLGLAGAGLTVALKDFIVAFLGWFVLMGKNGIRIGDLVEINGVTGEVVELGMFYTVLLETGDWSDSGHPTGRRVTFMNGFAIEGHYFNFSTSGRWLWDEVRIVVPAGRDPYPIVEAIQKQIEESTTESAHLAEAQWREARRSPHLDTLTVAPTIHLKPIAGGVEIDARYITHVAQRDELKAALYHTAVELLGAVASPTRAQSDALTTARVR